MTMKDYIDEIKLRLRRSGVTKKLSDAEIVTYINRARHEVQRMTMDLFPERYAVIAEIEMTQTFDADFSITTPYQDLNVTAYTATMPTDLIELYNVYLCWIDSSSGATYKMEARQLEKQEFFNVQMHSFNIPTMWRPVCTLDAAYNALTDTQPKTLYVAGLDMDKTSTLFDSASRVYLEIWYTAVVPDLEDAGILGSPDTELSIPPDYDELIVLYALMSCMRRLEPMVMKDSLNAEIKACEENIKSSYEIKYQKKDILLPSKEGLS